MRGVARFGGLVGLCVAAACGNSNSNGNDSATPDAAMPDAPMPDAATPDAPAFTPVVRSVIDNMTVPAANAQAIALGLDLNGDGVVDNQLGMVLAALAAASSSVQSSTDTAVARGSILLLGEVVLGAGGAGLPTDATFTMYTGANPRPAPCNGTGDVVCRRHLDGHGLFDLAATSAHDPPLTGTLSNGTLVAGPGHLQVPLMFGSATPVMLNLIGARVQLRMVTPETIGPSVIGGALTQSEIELKIHPGIQQNANAAVAADCTTTTPPDCGCLDPSSGRSYLTLFDTSPKDCVISLDEVRNNTLIRSLLMPDVTVEGQNALSFGFGVTAVKATFTP